VTFEVADDDGLRAAVQHCVQFPDEEHANIWHEIGAELLRRANRDVPRSSLHGSEFISAYIASAMDSLKRRPDRVINARSPWGLLVISARRVAVQAVAQEVAVGLTARDPLTHRNRPASLPKMLSLDRMRFEHGWDVIEQR